MLEKCSFVFTPLPYIVAWMFFIRAIFLDGAMDGIGVFFRPRIEKLWAIDTWKNALIHIGFSLSIGVGAMPILARHNKVFFQIIGIQMCSLKKANLR